MSTDQHTHEGETKTDLYCHVCNKNFVALLDYSLSGNHVIQCPFCSHFHYRVITNGKVTGQRYDSDHGTVDKSYKALRTWKHDSLPIQTSTASSFIRERWISRLQ